MYALTGGFSAYHRFNVELGFQLSIINGLYYIYSAVSGYSSEESRFKESSYIPI